MEVRLNEHLEKFVKIAIDSGRFESEDEVVREALRLLEERETRLARLRQEIETGRNSGEPVAYDPDGIKQRGRARLKETPDR